VSTLARAAKQDWLSRALALLQRLLAAPGAGAQ
jgi:hypothetical protein